MAAREEFNYAVGSSCCFGGQREKWFAFLNNCPSVQEALTRDCPGHEGLLSYQVTENPDGTLHYPTEEEAEYPLGLCVAYSEALKRQLENDQAWEKVHLAYRKEWCISELNQSTARLQNPQVAEVVARELYSLERKILREDPVDHLRQLIRMASYRGTSIPLMVHLDETAEEQHEIPYPAYMWEWKTIMSYAWKHEGHINELEISAYVNHLRHRGRSAQKFHTRWLHVLDSMVSRGCLAKGRSSSHRLNKQLRRATAQTLAQDSYPFPLWTISRWNFSDRASRRHGEEQEAWPEICRVEPQHPPSLQTSHH